MSKAKVCLWKALSGFLTQGFCRMWPAAVLSSRLFSQQWSTRTENTDRILHVWTRWQSSHTHLLHVSVWVLLTCSSDLHKRKHTRWAFLFFWSQKESTLLLQEQMTKSQHTLKHIKRNAWHKTNAWTFQWAGARPISTISWDKISTIYYGFLFLFCCFWFGSIYTSWIS